MVEVEQKLPFLTRKIPPLPSRVVGSHPKVWPKYNLDFSVILWGDAHKGAFLGSFLRVCRCQNFILCDPTTLEGSDFSSQKRLFCSTSNDGNRLIRSTFFTVLGAKYVFSTLKIWEKWSGAQMLPFWATLHSTQQSWKSDKMVTTADWFSKKLILIQLAIQIVRVFIQINYACARHAETSVASVHSFYRCANYELWKKELKNWFNSTIKKAASTGDCKKKSINMITSLFATSRWLL